MTSPNWLGRPARQWYRSLLQMSPISWALTLIALIGLGAVSYSLWRFGHTAANQPLNLIGYGLAISYLVGLWTGWARLDGRRPIIWRLVPRVSWFYGQTSRNLLIALAVQLTVFASYYWGLVGNLNLPWWQLGLLTFSLLIASVGVSWLGCGLAVLIKIVTRNYLARASLVVALLDLSWLVANRSRSVSFAIHHSWLNPTPNSTFLVLFLAIGLAGVGLALTELVLVRYRIQPAAPRAYWALALPSRALGGFGSGTALYVTQLLRLARSSRFHRQVLAGILLVIVGLLTLNAVTNLYQADAQTLFNDWLVIVVSCLTLAVSWRIGQTAVIQQRQYRFWPIKPNKLVAAHWATSVTVAIFLGAIFLQLFSRWGSDWLLVTKLFGWVVLSTSIAFYAGRAKAYHQPLAV